MKKLNGSVFNTKGTDMKKLNIPKRVEEEREDREHTTHGAGGQDRERITGNKKHHPSRVRPTGPTVTSLSENDADDKKI